MQSHRGAPPNKLGRSASPTPGHLPVAVRHILWGTLREQPWTRPTPAGRGGARGASALTRAAWVCTGVGVTVHEPRQHLDSCPQVRKGARCRPRRQVPCARRDPLQQRDQPACRPRRSLTARAYRSRKRPCGAPFLEGTMGHATCRISHIAHLIRCACAQDAAAKPNSIGLSTEAWRQQRVLPPPFPSWNPPRWRFGFLRVVRAAFRPTSSRAGAEQGLAAS